MLFKRSLLNLRTRAALKQNAAARQNRTFSTVQRVALLHEFTDSRQTELVYRFFDKLEKEGKKVDVLVIKDKSAELNIPEFIVTDVQAISALGKWNSEAVASFINRDYEYLLHLNMMQTEVSANILATSRALCRVGRYQDDHKMYYELMIGPGEDTLEKLIEQMYHYLQKI